MNERKVKKKNKRKIEKNRNESYISEIKEKTEWKFDECYSKFVPLKAVRAFLFMTKWK